MNFLKNKKIKIWGSVLTAIIALIIFIIIGRGSEQDYEFITVERGELIQEVSVTGKVKPAQSVDLQFENSGRIASVNYKAGDKVRFGAIIASLDNQDAQAQVLEKEAALESAQADLDQTIRNINSLDDFAINTALKTDLDNAEANLINVQKKVEDDLSITYDSGFNTINEAMTQADASFSVLKSLRETYGDTDSGKVQDAEDLAKVELYGLPSYNRLGAKDYVAAVNADKSHENIDTTLDKLNIAFTELRNAFSALQSAIQNNLITVSSSDRNTANSEAVSVASKLSVISDSIRNIVSQKITNEINISDAQSQLATARAAFPTQEDIIKKQAAVKQSQALLLSARSQLRKLLIIAPFSGVIARVDANRGETVTASEIIISMISAVGYQIEANITEFDISKIKIGDTATLTLDAYGPDILLTAVVSNVDPGETVIEGVTTYKTVLDFKESDLVLRPNMTANLDIQTNKKENVIAIPQRAVITKSGNKFVRLIENEIIREVQVETGLSGKDGLIEITEGLNEGDKVVTFTNN